MFYQKRKLRLVLLSIVTLWVSARGTPHASATTTAEAMFAAGTGHWGLGVIGQGKFWSSNHLTSNEISQARARDMEDLIEAESRFGWVLGVSQLTHKFGQGFSSNVSSVSTRSYFLGLTAEATRTVFVDFMVNFEETDPINAYVNGIDMKFSYVVEWGRFKNLASNYFLTDEEDGGKRPASRKKFMVMEDEFLTYPYVMLTFNPIFYQHRRKFNNLEQVQGNQAGLILSAKYFPNEKRAFRLFYSFFEYTKDKPRAMYSGAELQYLVGVRAGPMGSMAILRSFPKHYVGASFQSFTSGNFETELGLNRTTYEVGGLGEVYNPNVSLFKVLSNQKMRLGGSIDLVRGGVSGYSAAIHATKYW